MDGSKHDNCPACGVRLDNPNWEPKMNAIQEVRAKPRGNWVLSPIVDGKLLGFHFTCDRCGYQWTEDAKESE